MSHHVIDRLLERYEIDLTEADLYAIEAAIRESKPHVVKVARNDDGTCTYAVRHKGRWIAFACHDEGFLLTAFKPSALVAYRRLLDRRLEMLCRSGREPVPARQ